MKATWLTFLRMSECSLPVDRCCAASLLLPRILDYVGVTSIDAQLMHLSSLLCCISDKAHREDENAPSTGKVCVYALYVLRATPPFRSPFTALVFDYYQFAQMTCYQAQTQIQTANSSQTTAKADVYTPADALKLFKDYADDDDENVIGPEGLERLCNDAEIPLDGAMPMILAWQFEASEMMKFTKEEWTKGTASLKYVLGIRIRPPIHC
jgi:hypothetical protein